MAAEEEQIEDGMVALRSQEGVDFVVPTKEASLSIFIHNRLLLYGDQHIFPAHGDGDDSTKSKHTPILLRSITTHVLSEVLHHCKRRAALGHWDADSIGNVNLHTLYDLILASNELQVRGLLGKEV